MFKPLKLILFAFSFNLNGVSQTLPQRAGPRETRVEITDLRKCNLHNLTSSKYSEGEKLSHDRVEKFFPRENIFLINMNSIKNPTKVSEGDFRRFNMQKTNYNITFNHPTDNEVIINFLFEEKTFFSLIPREPTESQKEGLKPYFANALLTDSSLKSTVLILEGWLKKFPHQDNYNLIITIYCSSIGNLDSPNFMPYLKLLNRGFLECIHKNPEVINEKELDIFKKSAKIGVLGFYDSCKNGDRFCTDDSFRIEKVIIDQFKKETEVEDGVYIF